MYTYALYLDVQKNPRNRCDYEEFKMVEAAGIEAKQV